MTDVVESPAYSPVKSTSPIVVNSRTTTPNQSTPSTVVPERLATEQKMFSIAKLLDSNGPTNQSLSMGETSTLIAMREKIDERLRNSESEPRLLAPNNPMPLAFMNQLQLWNILQMMNPGAINFGSKSDQNEAEKNGFNFQQQHLQERNLLHPLAGVSGNSSNNSDLSRISRESSNASPNGSNASDGANDEDEFGLNSASGIRKKKTRTVFSRSQVSQLEMAFNTHRYLNSSQRSQLAITLGLTETQVKIWFQNRRNKWKRQANGEELNSSSTRPESTGPLSANLSSSTTNSFGNLGNTDAFRLFLQSQSAQFNPAQFMNQSSMTLPQLPQIFGMTTKNDSSANGSNAVSPIVSNAPNGFEFARLFASNFLNNSSLKNESASGSKKSSLVTKPETSSSNETSSE